MRIIQRFLVAEHNSEDNTVQRFLVAGHNSEDNTEVPSSRTHQ